MSPRDLISKLLAALADGAEIGDGLTLRVRPGTTATLNSSAPDGGVTVAFEPPPELAVRRGVVHLRCTLRGVAIGRDEVRLSIDGWFDRCWPVES